MLPAVCDLFSCMKVGGDKDRWLQKAAMQVSVLQSERTWRRGVILTATSCLFSPQM